MSTAKQIDCKGVNYNSYVFVCVLFFLLLFTVNMFFTSQGNTTKGRLYAIASKSVECVLQDNCIPCVLGGRRTPLFHTTRFLLTYAVYRPPLALTPHS